MRKNPQSSPGIVGRRVRERRRELKIPQWELADRIGVTQSVISELETGRRGDPSARTIVRLAKALGTTTDYLLGLRMATGGKKSGTYKAPFSPGIVGQRMRERRVSLAIPQWEVADRAGVTQAMVSALETGRCKEPWGKTLARLAKALDTTVDYLLGMDDLKGDKNAENGLGHNQISLSP